MRTITGFFRSSPASKLVGAVVLAAASAALSGGFAQGASSSTTVSVVVASATNLSAVACASGTANITDMGTLLPSQSSVTTSDCSITFGSSNDTSMLRVSQQDAAGVAMWAPPRGSLDVTAWGAPNGYTSWNPQASSDCSVAAAGPAGSAYIAFASFDGAQNDLMLARYLPSGVLDTAGFGAPNGWVKIDGAGGTCSGSNANELEVDPSGRILLMVSTGKIYRFLSGGTLDTAGFGSPNGYYTTTFTARAMAVQPDSKVLITGASGTDVETGRILATGTVDTTFNGTGSRVTDMGSTDKGWAVSVLPSGKIVVGATRGTNAASRFAALRYNSDGTLDTAGFGNPNGYVHYLITGGYNHVSGVDYDSSGRTFLAGDAWGGVDENATVVALEADGSLATGTFGAPNGFVALDLSTTRDIATSVKVLPDGRIVTGGYSYFANPACDDMLMARYLSSGVLDTTLNGTGYVHPQATSDRCEYARHDSLTFLEDGRTLVTGPDDWFNIVTYVFNAASFSQYVDTVSDWDTAASTNMFGACLRAVAGGASAQWTASATCPAVDGAYWNAIPTVATKIAFASSAGTVAATANLRFGARTSSGQPPGSYAAPISFDVVAPNV